MLTNPLPYLSIRKQSASDASLLRRLESAAGRVRHLEAENQQLREALALALGERRAADALDNSHHRLEKKPRSSDLAYSPADGYPT
jgi:hypothetical protein